MRRDAARTRATAAPTAPPMAGPIGMCEPEEATTSAPALGEAVEDCEDCVDDVWLLDPPVDDAVERPEDVVVAEDGGEDEVWGGDEVGGDDGGLEGAEVGGVDDSGGCEVGGAVSDGVNWMKSSQ